jgi:hypothetical protein
MKMVHLKENEALKNFFQEMVIDKKQMSEEEFWCSFLETGSYRINQIALDEALGIKRFDSREFQSLGISNKPFSFTRIENKQT